MILNRVSIFLLSFSLSTVARACHSQYYEMKAARRSLEDIQIQVMVHKYSMKHQTPKQTSALPAAQCTSQSAPQTHVKK